MTRGKAMSDDLRGVLLNMARTMDISEICRHTGCKKRTVERVMEDYCKKGTVMREHLRLEMRGAKRSMTTGDIRVHFTLCIP
jgi:predicted DNA-binding transcriptional regulator